MTKYASGSDGHKANHLFNGPSQDVVSGVASAEIAVPFGASTQVIRIVNKVACRYIIGATPQTALATSALLTADTIEYVAVKPGQVISAIQDIAAGVLNVIECGN